jgi:hypothetical protein
MVQLKSKAAWKSGEWTRFESICKVHGWSIQQKLTEGLAKGLKTGAELIAFIKEVKS